MNQLMSEAVWAVTAGVNYEEIFSEMLDRGLLELFFIPKFRSPTTEDFVSND